MKTLLGTLAGAVLFCGGTAKAEQFLECPRAIAVPQPVAAPDPAWEAVANKRLPPPTLVNVEVYADHPNKMGALVPDDTQRTSQAEVSTWSLPADSTPYWMACVYSDSRTLLVRQMPTEVKRCILTVALLQKRRNGITSFICR